MNNVIKYTYAHSLIPHEIIERHVTALAAHKKTVCAALDEQYNSVYASLYAPYDSHVQEQAEYNAQQMRELKPAAYIVVGIGGSLLGTMAVQQALSQTTKAVCSFYYVDTFDVPRIHMLSDLMRRTVANGEVVLVTCISKSGSTLETIANSAVLLQIIQEYYPRTWQKYVTIITDAHSPLEQYACDHAIAWYTVPKQVGGRYSVLSMIGLLPLAVIGIDVRALCAGARDVVDELQHNQNMLDYATISAAIIYEQYRRGMYIHDTFLFAPQLENFGAWYRQLCAESLGKMNNMHEPVGITPTVSIGTTDLHSMVQLYIGGPANRLTSFVELTYADDIPISQSTLFDYVGKGLDRQTYNSMMHIACRATQKAYADTGKPYIHSALADLSAYTLGAFMQYNMLQIMYLGYLLQLNPFDQTDVEQYKHTMRELLHI